MLHVYHVRFNKRVAGITYDNFDYGDCFHFVDRKLCSVAARAWQNCSQFRAVRRCYAIAIGFYGNARKTDSTAADVLPGSLLPPLLLFLLRLEL